MTALSLVHSAAALERAARTSRCATDPLTSRLMRHRIEDALLGVVAEPEPLERRMDALIGATIELLSDDAQVIRFELDITGCCPALRIPVVLQAAHEMVGHAVLSGMRLRLVGSILVSLGVATKGGLALCVRDDGWAPPDAGTAEAPPFVTALATQNGGSASVVRDPGWTIATMSLPSPG